MPRKKKAPDNPFIQETPAPLKAGQWALEERRRPVPSEYVRDYEEFLQEGSIDLRREIATVRTLYLEVRKNLDERENSLAIGMAVGALEKADVPEDVSRPILERFFGVRPLGIDDAVKLSQLLEAAGKQLERAKKLEEGFTYKIDINDKILIKVLQACVFPVVSVAQQALIARQLQNFDLGKAMSLVPVSQHVIDVDAEEVDE